jgi:hypothetical protein
MYVSDVAWEVRSLRHVTRDWVQSLVSTYATVIAAGGTYALWHMWQQAGSLSAGKLAYLALYYVVIAPIVAAFMTSVSTLVHRVLGVERAALRMLLGAAVGALTMCWAFPPNGSPFFGVGMICGGAGAYLASRFPFASRPWMISFSAAVPISILLIHVVTTLL